VSTGLFLLRVTELGLRVRDLEELDYGLVADMLSERSNDGFDYQEVATQEDFDRF
jgi:hypothetical protein